MKRPGWGWHCAFMFSAFRFCALRFIGPAALLLVGTVAYGGDDVALTPSELLGKNLFFDNISAPDTMSCASCHSPGAGWTGPDGDINALGAVHPGAVTERFGNRKPPSAAYATQSPVLHQDDETGEFVGGNFTDGRATGEKLGNPAADQALGPFLNAVEMNNADKQSVLQQIGASDYAHLWVPAFGEMLRYDTPEEIERNYDRIGLAIADYEGSSEVNAFTSKYDYYLKGMVALTEQESRGLELFNHDGNCAACHPSAPGPDGEPPLFTDFGYDNLGVPKNPDNPFYEMDDVLLDDGTPINPEGADWIDPGLAGFLATRPEWAHLADENLGKHKVPTLRNVALGPEEGFPKAFMHNGVFKSLEEVVDFYNSRDTKDWPDAEVPQNVNTADMGDLMLSRQDRADIVAFLHTLSDGYAIPEPAGVTLLGIAAALLLVRRRVSTSRRPA